MAFSMVTSGGRRDLSACSETALKQGNFALPTDKPAVIGQVKELVFQLVHENQVLKAEGKAAAEEVSRLNGEICRLQNVLTESNTNTEKSRSAMELAVRIAHGHALSDVSLGKQLSAAEVELRSLRITVNQQRAAIESLQKERGEGERRAQANEAQYTALMRELESKTLALEDQIQSMKNINERQAQELAKLKADMVKLEETADKAVLERESFREEAHRCRLAYKTLLEKGDSHGGAKGSRESATKPPVTGKRPQSDRPGPIAPKRPPPVKPSISSLLEAVEADTARSAPPKKPMWDEDYDDVVFPESRRARGNNL